MNTPINVILLERVGSAKHWNTFRRMYPKWDTELTESQRRLFATSVGPKLLPTKISQSEYNERIKSYETDNNACVFLCLVDEDPAGYVICKKVYGYTENVWFIYELFISEKYRGHGYGKEVLVSVERYLRTHGAKYTMLRVHENNHIAKNLYTGQKYVKSAAIMYKKL